MNSYLTNKNFILLISSNFISRIGTVIYNVVLAWWITEETHSARNMGLVLASGILPTVLFSLIGGVICDNLNKRKIIIVADVFGGITCLGLTIMARNNIVDILLLMLINFILGTCSCIFKPAFKALIPDVLANAELIAGNTVINCFTETSKVIAPAIAAALLVIPRVGVAGAFLINSFSFFIAAFFEYFIKYTYKKDKRKLSFKMLFHDLVDGFVYVYNEKVLFISLLCITIANFFLAPYDVLLPLFTQNILKSDGSFYSIILMVYSIGGISVILITLFIKKYRLTGKLLAITCMLLGIPFLIIGLNYNNLITLISVFLYGLINGIFNTNFFTYIQEKTENKYIGRIFSIMYFMAFMITPLASLFFGFIGDYYLKYIFQICGFIVVLIGMIYMHFISKLDISATVTD